MESLSLALSVTPTDLITRALLLYSMEALEQFVDDLLDGSLKPFIRSDPVPEKTDGLIKVRDAEFLARCYIKALGCCVLTEGMKLQRTIMNDQK